MNARGVRSKLVSLKLVLTQIDPDIVAISETNLKCKQKVRSITKLVWLPT